MNANMPSLVSAQQFQQNDTFLKPEGIEVVLVVGRGGGGGGGGGVQYISDAYEAAGGSGGDAAPVVQLILFFPKSEQRIPVGVGDGGPGGKREEDGHDGKSSHFGQVTFPPGKGGPKGQHGNQVIPVSQAHPGGAAGGRPGERGEALRCPAAETGGVPYYASLMGGGGGSVDVTGGKGGNAHGTAGSAPVNSGAGGGGGAFFNPGERADVGPGGAGGSGLVWVAYGSQSAVDSIGKFLAELKTSLGQLPSDVMSAIMNSEKFDAAIKNKVDDYLKEKAKG